VAEVNVEAVATCAATSDAHADLNGAVAAVAAAVKADEEDAEPDGEAEEDVGAEAACTVAAPDTREDLFAAAAVARWEAAAARAASLLDK
jgi:hypothetical protein